MIDKARKDAEIIEAILHILNDKEWNADTLDDIAALLNSNGYIIRDVPNDELAL